MNTKWRNPNFTETVLRLDMSKSPQPQLVVPHRIGHKFTDTVEKFNAWKVSPALPDKSYSTFFYFQNLPYDIRFLVWKLAASIPRDLDIWPLHTGTFTADSNPDVELTPRMWRFLTTSPIPAILHATQESRTIGLKFFVLSFGANYHCPSFHGITFEIPPRIYYNIEFDRVCLMTSTAEAAGDSFTWVSVVKQVFDRPGMSVAICISPIAIYGLTKRSSFLSIFDKHKEVLFFSLHNLRHLNPPQSPVVMKFAGWIRNEEKIEGMPSLGMELKAKIHRDIQGQISKRIAEVAKSHGDQTTAMDGSPLPAAKWASLELIDSAQQR